MRTFKILSAVGVVSGDRRSRRIAGALVAAMLGALVLAAAASATSLTIPAGVEATLAEAHLGFKTEQGYNCPADSLTYGYQLNGSENLTVGEGRECATLPGAKIGPFAHATPLPLCRQQQSHRRTFR